jgi:hypothetical protein
MDSRKMGNTMVFRGVEYKVLAPSGKNSCSIDLNLNSFDFNSVVSSLKKLQGIFLQPLISHQN